MKKIVFIILIGVFVLPFIAEGADRGGYYFISAGIDNPKEEIDVPLYFADMGIRTETDSGILINLGGGLQAFENLRIEGEAAYRKNHIDNVKVTYSNVLGLGVDGGEGDIKCLSFMVNTWYDHFFGKRLSLYLGGGIGAARVSVKDFLINTYPIVPNPTKTERGLIDNTDWRFAYQAGVGVGYKLNETFVIDLGYRYFATSDPELSDVERNGIKMDNSHDSFLLSIRYNF